MFTSLETWNSQNLQNSEKNNNRFMGKICAEFKWMKASCYSIHIVVVYLSLVCLVLVVYQSSNLVSPKCSIKADKQRSVPIFFSWNSEVTITITIKRLLGIIASCVCVVFVCTERENECEALWFTVQAWSILQQAFIYTHLLLHCVIFIDNDAFVCAAHMDYILFKCWV